MANSNQYNDPGGGPVPQAQFGHYRLVELLGRGGMGEVWLADDTKLKRRVALKFLSSELADKSEYRRRFVREAQAAAGLQHSNVVTVHEVNNEAERPFFAMSYVQGKTLDRYAQERKPGIAAVIELAIQICEGLGAAHEQGITHRDLKPGNVMVVDRASVKILDFGLAVRPESEGKVDPEETVTRLSSLGVASGTVPYMAPEQLTGQEVTPRVDIFALGVMLYEMAAGKHPFAGPSQNETAARILRDEPPSLSDSLPELPYDLRRIIERCLRKDPERRFQTVADVRNELLDLQALLKQGDAAAITSMPGRQSGLTVEEFVLTADMVRQLNYQSPKMIGDRMVYYDNHVDSDVLVIYLHAWGLDHRSSEEFLEALPCRGVAPTLYGFDEHARHRLPLTLEDQSVLFGNLFADLDQRLSPAKVLLMGFSSGADHALHLVCSETGPRIRVDAIVPFGCNTNRESCFLSRRFAQLQGSDPAELLDEIKAIGSSTRSIGEWLKFHEYMLTVFSKFRSNADPLRAYGSGIAGPFLEDDWRQFARWYRTVMERVPVVRFIMDADEAAAVEMILEHHLKDNVLGDAFHPETIVQVETPHVQLASPEILLEHTLAAIDLLQSD